MLAGHYADEMAQIEALRRAVLAAGADLAARDARLAELEQQLKERDGVIAERDDVIGQQRDERAAQARTLRDFEELRSARAAAIVELEGELEALKRIDLSRTP